MPIGGDQGEDMDAMDMGDDAEESESDVLAKTVKSISLLKSLSSF